MGCVFTFDSFFGLVVSTSLFSEGSVGMVGTVVERNLRWWDPINVGRICESVALAGTNGLFTAKVGSKSDMMLVFFV